jgi:hypothetical protein
VDAVNLPLLFVFYFFYFSIRVLVSTKVDASDLLSASTLKVAANNRSLEVDAVNLLLLFPF